MTKDNHGVITHSSPIEFWESLACVGQKIEDMTLAQVTSCQMALTNYTFISAAELLAYANNKAIVMVISHGGGRVQP